MLGAKKYFWNCIVPNLCFAIWLEENKAKFFKKKVRYVADVQNRLKNLTCYWSEKINPLYSCNCCLVIIIFITTSVMYENYRDK